MNSLKLSPRGDRASSVNKRQVWQAALSLETGQAGVFSAGSKDTATGVRGRDQGKQETRDERPGQGRGGRAKVNKDADSGGQAEASAKLITSTSTTSRPAAPAGNRRSGGGGWMDHFEGSRTEGK